jgi:predicted amidohydrolase YtcJ
MHRTLGRGVLSWCGVVGVTAILVLSLRDISVAHGASPVYEFRGGQWFNGVSFSATTMYTHDGILSAERPKRIDEVVDIAGRFVIPPMAEGHNHWLEPQFIDAYVAKYLREGVFYVRDMANAPYIVNQFRDRLNIPTSVDFVSALQGFTGPNAHPLEVFREFRKMGVLPSQWTNAELDKNAMMVVSTPGEVDADFNLLLTEKPALVKAFLLYSENYAAGDTDPSHMYKRGMDPSLLPQVVQLAHAHGLTVAVHAYSAADFHTALMSGADEIAHLPGTGYDKSLGVAHFRISDADAQYVADHHIRVDTTLSWLEVEYGDDAKTKEAIERDVILPNLRKLKAHGVKFILGSDQFRQSSLFELTVLSQLGVFSNLDLLRLACVDTPRVVFPTRMIGVLKPGYEGSFLVLAKNPLASIENIQSIVLRVKQGHRLGPELWSTPMPPPPAD